MSIIKIRQSIFRGVIYIILSIMVIQALYPIIWVVMSSLNPGASLFSTKLIPEKLTIIHYVELFTEKQYGLWYLNTLKIATITMIISLIFVTTTGYALSMFRFKGRRTGLMTLLVLQMFPIIINMTSIYVLLYFTGLLDTHFGLILLYVGGYILPGYTWYVKGFFDSIPRSISEAAKIDGASNMNILRRVMLPLSFPVMTFLALVSFILPWMDFAFARLILTSTANRTLALGLYDMIVENSRTDFTMFAAGAVLIAAPITILYACLQRYLINGLSEGAAKY